MHRFLAIVCLLISFTAAKGYELVQPSQKVYTDLRQEFAVITSHIVEIGPLKPHPKIIWLDQSNHRVGASETMTRVGFLIKAPGTIKFPPIPVVIENKSFFLRLNDLQAIRNPAPTDNAAFDVLWNREIELPQTIHLGEAIEIDFIGHIKTSGKGYPYFQMPVSNVDHARWHIFTRPRGRNVLPQDYFFDFTNSLFSSRRAQRGDSELDGEHAKVRAYKARLICSELGTVSGHFGMTLGFGQHRRTHLIPFNFEVSPLPPLPNDRVINTGLVGDWDFSSRITPSRIEPNEPLKITIHLEGKGDPNIRNDFDFSREGFPSVDSSLRAAQDSNYQTWEGEFTQTIIPSGKVATFQGITLASFDTKNDQWKLHKISPAMTLEGMVDITKTLTPASALGKAVKRPILLNFPPATFAAFAFAPFLPFLLGLMKRRLDQRDPVRREQQQKLRRLIQQFKSSPDSHELIDDSLLPLLRFHLNLPSGASTREVADALEENQSELASLLRTHSEATFSGSSSSTDLKALATQLAKISLIALISFSHLRADSLEEANLSFSEERYSEAVTHYKELIDEHPGQAHLYRNLALAYLAIDDPARARAACHTALLLSPLDRDARLLMDDIRIRLGVPELPGTRLFELRPDQWFVFSATIWVFSFLLLGLRHFFSKIPRWFVWVGLTLAIFAIGAGAWRNHTAYSENQYMVLGDEVPREPEAGTPNWNFTPLRGGQIVHVSETTTTHAQISSKETSFWIPLNQLQQVW